MFLSFSLLVPLGTYHSVQLFLMIYSEFSRRFLSLVGWGWVSFALTPAFQSTLLHLHIPFHFHFTSSCSPTKWASRRGIFWNLIYAYKLAYFLIIISMMSQVIHYLFSHFGLIVSLFLWVYLPSWAWFLQASSSKFNGLKMSSDFRATQTMVGRHIATYWSRSVKQPHTWTKSPTQIGLFSSVRGRMRVLVPGLSTRNSIPIES